MLYVTTRQLATKRRQYEFGDLVDTTTLTDDELAGAVRNGSVVPCRFLGTAAELAARNPLVGPGQTAYETDTGVLKIGTDGATRYNSLSQVGTGTYARAGGPLRLSKTKLADSPSTYKAVFCGDSTSDSATAAGLILRRLMSFHAQQGEALAGVAPGDFYTNGTGNGTTTFVDASGTANFTSADIGKHMHGKGFPLSTNIASVTNSTTVVLGAVVPSGTSLPFYVCRHLISGGNNGVLLSDWFANPSSGSFPYNRDKLVADAPDLVVYSWLFNDIRLGGLGITVDAIVTAGIALLKALVDWTRANLPNADILLRMPNTILTADVSSLHFVSDGTTINAAGIAQIYTNALRRIYLHFIGYAPNVDVLDIQGEVYGTASAASHAYNADQLHPSTQTLSDITGYTVSGGGYCAIADAVAARIGFARNAFSSDGAQRVRHRFVVYDGPVANTLRLISADPYGIPAPQAPVFKADSLYINGAASPISLASATIDRTFSSTVLSITSLTGDWSPYIGKTAAVVGSHAPQSTGDRQQIFIDLPNIVAGTTVPQAVTVTGAGSGQTGTATAIVPSPGNGFGASGLLLLGCYPTGTDAVRLVIQNPTGADINLAGESWTFWVMR